MNETFLQSICKTFFQKTGNSPRFPASKEMKTTQAACRPREEREGMDMKRILCLTLMLALVLSAVLAPTAALAASDYSVRTTASVNLRKGPGLGYAKITSLKSGRTLTYAGVSQFDSRGMGWHKVYYNGSTAWISWAYSNLQANGKAISESRAVRATAALNVRTGAGTGNAKITTVANGTNMIYLGETATVGGSTWYKVTTSAGIGWVSGAYSRLVSTPDVKPVSSSGSSSGSTTGTKVYVSGGSVWLRTGPGLGYKSVTTVHEGQNLNYRGSSSVDDRGVRWYNVTYNGQSVWISSRYAKLS